MRDVLVVLLQRRGRPVPAELVLDLVWGEAAGGLTVAAVHTVVARLRRQLGTAAISSSGFGYLVDRGVATDEDTFTDLLVVARSCLDRDNRAGAVRSYRAAIGTWRGPEAFADCAAELVEADRSRLAELRMVATEELVAALLGQSAPDWLDEARALTEGLIAAHPLRERPYQLGMLAAYRSHRQAEALEMYQNLRRRLRDELGIEPTRTSAELNTKILRQDPMLDVPGPDLAIRPTVSAVRRRPPAPVTPLFGRSAEFGRLLEALAQGRRLVTLVGPGGVGKSRLLIELGARRQEMKAVVYAEMSGLTEVGPDELAAAIAAGQDGLDPRRPPVESLVAGLADGFWLLLIDEAEWVVDPLASVLTSILANCPGVQIVLTSRIPLDIAGECLIAVEPFGVANNDDDIAAVLAAPAVRFLAERLADRAVSVGSDSETALLLSKIARQADGLPLALELAAGRAAGQSLADIALQVELLLDIPAAHRSPGDRHRTLRDTLTWSIDRLTSDSRTVLQRLTVFAGRFTVADAEVICGAIADVPDIVRSLAREALVHVERTDAARLCFRLLRTVRDLVAEDFAVADLEATQARHRRWVAGLSGADGVDVVDAVLSSFDDHIQALRTALASRDASTLTDLTVALAEYWRYTGGQVVGVRWLGRVLDSELLDQQNRARIRAHRAAVALHH
ncbi:MAG: BTAD domain-containing putative transcriptional regulator, partial [Nakamurella sp.]